MILRGKMISGPEAFRIGLVQEIWPIEEVKRRAHDLAEELAQQPPLAIAGVLRAVIGAGEKSLEEGLMAEREAVNATFGTKDQQEGMRAFLEKRKPRFTGE
jgi:enoyl-CoA hydratase